MVQAGAKTPNKKRKSLANVEGESQTPKLAKTVETPSKVKNNATPGKGKNNPTPGKDNKGAAQNSVVKTPKPAQEQQTPKSPQKTPAKSAEPDSVKKSGKKNRKTSENESDVPPKKLKKFPGTASLVKKEKGEEKAKKEKKKLPVFFSLRQKVQEGDAAAIKEIENKIKSYESRKELSKTAKRKLKVLQKLRGVAAGEEPATVKVKKETSKSNLSVSQKRRQRKKNVKAQKAAEEAGNKVEVKKEKSGKEKKQIKGPVMPKEEEESSDSEYEVETEVKPDKIIKTEKEEDDESGEEEEDDDEVEDEDEGEEEEESGEEEEDQSGEEEDDESAEDEQESSDEEAADSKEIELMMKDNKGKKTQPKQNKTPNLQELKDNKIVSKGQSRYVVFVGNLPYDVTKQEITEHFKKAGQVKHIRIPNDKQTNKPRGFAYVEFHDEETYQRGLSLHHTFVKGRRINVLYTQGGKKKGEDKKKEVKSKNLKLQAMRKQGQLAGSVKENQKRSARRAKKNTLNGSNS